MGRVENLEAHPAGVVGTERAQIDDDKPIRGDRIRGYAPLLDRPGAGDKEA